MSDPIKPISQPPVSFKKKAERLFGRICLAAIVPPVRALSMPSARRLGGALGMLIYRSLSRYRHVAHKNIHLIYGDELSDAEQTKMAKDVFRHFGQWAMEFIKMPQISDSDIDNISVAAGEENVTASLADGRGALLISGHLGSWEFIGRWLTQRGFNLNVVARDARNPAATKIMEKTRLGNGANVLYRGNSARGIFKALKRNEIVAILPDQNAADVFVPFFGKQTGTVDGPAVLHLRTGAPLLFCWCIRGEEGKFHITFEPPVIIEKTGDQQADILSVMTLINERLEIQIRKYPTQWLWLHDRWKASPGVFPDGEDQAAQLKLTAAQYESLQQKRDGRA